MLITRSGTPGSGKTYHAVQEMLNTLKKYDDVLYITNISIIYDEVAKYLKKDLDFVTSHIKVYDNIYLNPNLFYNYYNLYPDYRFVLIIDEADDLLNSRQWQKGDRMSWLQFLRMHRHLNFDVFLLAQGRKTLDKQILMLFDTDYTYRKVSKFGLIGGLLWFFIRRIGYYVEVYVPVKARSHSGFFIFKKQIFKCYDSFTLKNYDSKFLTGECKYIDFDDYTLSLKKGDDNEKAGSY